MLRIDSVNRAVREQHPTFELVRANPEDAYFYFVDTAHPGESHSVYTPRLNDLPLSMWLEEAGWFAQLLADIDRSRELLNVDWTVEQ